jgi:AraC-like DNA-binding protein
VVNSLSISPECGAWDSVKHGWRQLYGSFSRQGLSIEQHDFISNRPINWGRSFHHDSVELCLNLEGQGTVRAKSQASVYTPRTIGFYCNARQDLSATRVAREQHTFITIELSRDYLVRQLEPCVDFLQPAIRNWLSGKPSSSVGEVDTMTSQQQTLFTGLRQPPVAPSAYALWYQAKALEILSQVAFPSIAAEELFCQRHKRVSRERVERAALLLQAGLVEPPDIEELGAQVGCSPFYLSRIFSREMGMTIPQYVRELRMESAAQLLLEGRHNVTEAAMAVGYSSLSHFSKAFCQSIGCCPVLFPSAKALVEQFLLRPSRFSPLKK